MVPVRHRARGALDGGRWDGVSVLGLGARLVVLSLGFSCGLSVSGGSRGVWRALMSVEEAAGQGCCSGLQGVVAWIGTVPWVELQIQRLSTGRCGGLNADDLSGGRSLLLIL